MRKLKNITFWEYNSIRKLRVIEQNSGLSSLFVAKNKSILSHRLNTRKVLFICDLNKNGYPKK